MKVDELGADLLAERGDLLTLVDDLDDATWETPTPAPGWTVRDQFAHLAWFDQAATQAIVDPDAFRAHRADALADVDGFVERVRVEQSTRSGPAVAAWLDETGERLVASAGATEPGLRVPWYGPDMSVASSITARIMETWAHGQDVADGLGTPRPPSPRLHHVAFIGWRAVPNSFLARGRAVPDAPVRVEVGDPDLGDVILGADDAADVVRGSLLDFCLVVTQRRHPDDTDLVAEGPVATEWLTIAQAFAGPPGEGREPGQFA